MTSWTDIGNLAAIDLKVNPITSLDPSDGSKLASSLQPIYQMLADEVIRAHPWNCAMAQANLGASGTAPLFGFAYAYRVPTAPKCLRVWQAGPDLMRNGGWAGGTRWRKFGDFIYTNAPPPLPIVFMQQLTDPSGFDADLVTAIAKRFAWAAAYTVTQQLEVEAARKEDYEQLLGGARSIDAQEGTPPDADSHGLEEARY